MYVMGIEKQDVFRYLKENTPVFAVDKYETLINLYTEQVNQVHDIINDDDYAFFVLCE